MKTGKVKTVLLIMMSIMMMVTLISNIASASGEMPQDMQVSRDRSDGDGLLALAAGAGAYTVTMQPLQGEVTDYDSGRLRVEVLDTGGNPILDYNFSDQSEVSGGK